MTKEEFKEIENKLKIFYQRKKITDGLKFKIKRIEEQIEEIDDKIKNNKVNIKEEDTSISYNERVQSSGDKTSYAEKAFIKEIENLEKENYRKKELKNKLEERLRDIELDNETLEINIKDLSEEYKELLQEKYKKGNPDWLVAQNLHKSKSAVNRIKSNLIKNIYTWLRWLN